MIKYGVSKKDLKLMKEANDNGIIEKDAELEPLLAKKKRKGTTIYNRLQTIN